MSSGIVVKPYWGFKVGEKIYMLWSSIFVTFMAKKYR